MNKQEPEWRHLLALLVFMSGVSTCPPATAGLAEVVTEPDEVAAEPVKVIETGAPVIPGVIRRILADPDRDYASARGQDDCSSESLYNTARGMLGKYADNPEANSSILKEYIMSGEEQCNCTAAIVGKDFEILLTHLGTNISSVPCL